MPFGTPFDRYFTNIIAPAVIDASYEPVRADSLFTSTQIIADIWRLTRSANILLADLSGKNPNVFYELGLAHAIGKPVVLISNSIDDVPFDLRALRIIIYDKEDESWGKNLRLRIATALRETNRDLASAVPLPFVERPQVERPQEDPTTYEIRRIWDEIRAIRTEQAASVPPSSVPSGAEFPIDKFIATVRQNLDPRLLTWANDSILARVILDVLARRPIDAIKFVRQETGWGLKESKDWVDQFRRLFGTM